MKTAKEFLAEHRIYDPEPIYDSVENEHPLEELLKSYASEVAKEVLKRASENAKTTQVQRGGTHTLGGFMPNYITVIDDSSILNTPFEDLLK